MTVSILTRLKLVASLQVRFLSMDDNTESFKVLNIGLDELVHPEPKKGIAHFTLDLISDIVYAGGNGR